MLKEHHILYELFMDATFIITLHSKRRRKQPNGPPCASDVTQHRWAELTVVNLLDGVQKHFLTVLKNNLYVSVWLFVCQKKDPSSALRVFHIHHCAMDKVIMVFCFFNRAYT